MKRVAQHIRNEHGRRVGILRAVGLTACVLLATTAACKSRSQASEPDKEEWRSKDFKTTDCKATPACSVQGRCQTTGGGFCRARTPEDCKASVECKKLGNCRPAEEGCLPGSNEECQQSTACSEDQKCFFVAASFRRAAAACVTGNDVDGDLISLGREVSKNLQDGLASGTLPDGVKERLGETPTRNWKVLSYDVTAFEGGEANLRFDVPLIDGRKTTRTELLNASVIKATYKVRNEVEAKTVEICLNSAGAYWSGQNDIKANLPGRWVTRLDAPCVETGTSERIEAWKRDMGYRKR